MLGFALWITICVAAEEKGLAVKVPWREWLELLSWKASSSGGFGCAPSPKVARNLHVTWISDHLNKFTLKCYDNCSARQREKLESCKRGLGQKGPPNYIIPSAGSKT